MIVQLKKSEIVALRQICQQEGSIKELSARLGAKPSFTSRVLDSLRKKGLVEFTQSGTMKIIRLSSASHAQHFKQLVDSRPEAKIEKWLSGYAMEILIATVGGASTKLILKECGCTRATLYKTLKALGSAGAVFWKDGNVSVPDRLLAEFVSAYADNLELLILRELRGHNFTFRLRKHVIVRTDAENVPEFFTKTGSTALAEKGLEALLPANNDYCFDLDRKKREIGIEEEFVHALVLTNLQAQQDTPVLAIFYAKNRRKMNFRTLKSIAKYYGVEEAWREIRRNTEFYDKMKDMER